jgi:DNA-directed RNA polymerase specialized sigma24 family protein
LSDRKGEGDCCQTKKGPGRPRAPGVSERVTFRLRRTQHDEILDVLDSLPERARSAWIVHALLCYVRGEIRDVEREAVEIGEELAADLFGMWEEEDGEAE